MADILARLRAVPATLGPTWYKAAVLAILRAQE